MDDNTHNKDLVSVIVPVFNVAPYLNECLISISGQTYKDLEILLIDDGSTDGCGDICDKWALRDTRIRVIHQSNRGLSAARNAGLDRASGSFVIFVDPDDTIAAYHVELLHRTAMQTGAPCVMCGFTRIDLRGGVRTIQPTEHVETIDAHECVARLLAPAHKGKGTIYVTAWGKIYARDVFEGTNDLDISRTSETNRHRIRFPDGEVYEDLSTIIPIVCASERVALIPNVLYTKRERADSITQNSTNASLCDLERAFERMTSTAKTLFPDLSTQADAYLEHYRVNTSLQWHKLWRQTSDPEACEGAHRTRQMALAYPRTLSSHLDVRTYLKLQLLRFSPDLALAAQTVWQALMHTG